MDFCEDWLGSKPAAATASELDSKRISSRIAVNASTIRFKVDSQIVAFVYPEGSFVSCSSAS